jgi:hypothetical protein
MASISKIITFVPTIGDNEKKPESEQFAVKLRAVKVEKKQMQLRKFIEMDPKKLMKEMMDVRQQGEIVALLKEHFVRFVNFDVDDEATKEDEAAKRRGFVGGEERELREGDIYSRPALIEDIFELGEYELAMEIFMHMIGSSQLRKTLPPKPEGEGGKELPTVTEDRQDEEKNSESPSGIIQIPNVH